MEFNRDKLIITYNPWDIKPEEVLDYLKTSYWAASRTLEEIKTTIENSILVMGLLYEGKLIGFARVITDCVVFGYLCDVFVKEPYRGYGLGKLIVTEIMNHPKVKKLKRLALNTRDAQTLYQKYGFLYDDKKLLPDGNVTYSMSYIKVSDEYFIKHFSKEDMDDTVRLVETHWDSNLVRLIHPMFYRDFYKTSFAARSFDGELIGFVLAFSSQDSPGEGYIHAAFVHPDWRHKAVAKNLYNKVFLYLLNKGVSKVRLITTPDNKLSQSFHQHLGFQYAKECNIKVGEIPVASDYYGSGKHRVVMEKLFFKP